MILSRSGRRVEVALAHNEKCCVTRANDPSPSLRQASSGVGYYSITRPENDTRCATKAIGPLGFSSIYRPARVSQTRSSAGIASTHRLTAVASACYAETGLVNCPVAVCAWRCAAFKDLAPVLVRYPTGVNVVVGQGHYHTRLCGKIIRRSAGNPTVRSEAGEELS